MAPATSGRAADVGLPLPDAPVRVVIPDAAAFDAALTGQFRNALAGAVDESDPLARGWRQTQVGSKLADQWSKLSPDLPWTWNEIRKLQPRAVGLSLLNVGHLEAVLVIETPLAVLPNPLPAGRAATHAGASYHVVAAGAGDGSSDSERRMGLAYAQLGGRLFLATSERALKLALDAAQADRLFAPPAEGLVSLDLDLDELRKNLYFRREFAFEPGPEAGHVRAALRQEQGRLVEVREGVGEPRGPAALFDLPGVAAAGWEPDAEGFWPALRAALLEPIPVLDPRPVAVVGPLPPAKQEQQEDRYMVNLERAAIAAGGRAFEAGDLAGWAELLEKHPVSSWGFALDRDSSRRLVFAWPEAAQADLERQCRTTIERRAGRASVVAVGGAREIQVGPGLPALALKRAGAYVWIGPNARSLSSVPTPQPGGDVVRWGRADLDALRAEAPRWAKVEGPASTEQVRPFSDRILGLLGWIPDTHSLRVERRKNGSGWTERVEFGGQ